jgi:tRNA threonylcarbamoyladenosine biosynthesis protein TsaE
VAEEISNEDERDWLSDIFSKKAALGLFERFPAFLAMKKKQVFNSKSQAETIEFGRRFARKLKPGTLVGLVGDLGSGKTSFVKGMALGLGVKDKREVHSPTFVIFHIYKGRIPLYHFDLYRLENTADLEAVGADEFLTDKQAVSVVEWADRIPEVLTYTDIYVKFLMTSETTRTIQIDEQRTK